MHAPTMLQRTEGLIRQTQRVLARTPCLAAAQHAFAQWSAVRRVLTDSGAIVPLGGPASRPVPATPVLAPQHSRPDESGMPGPWDGAGTPPMRTGQRLGGVVPLRPSAAGTLPIERGAPADTGSTRIGAPLPPTDSGRPTTPVPGGAAPRLAPIHVRLNPAPVTLPEVSPPLTSESPGAADADARPGRPRPATAERSLQPRVRSRRIDGPVVRVVAKQVESVDVLGATDALARADARSRPTAAARIEPETPDHPAALSTPGHQPPIGQWPTGALADALPTIEPSSGGQVRPTGLALRGSTVRRGRAPQAVALPLQVRAQSGPGSPHVRPIVPAGPRHAELPELSPSHSAAPDLRVDALPQATDRAPWETGEDDLHRLGEQLERLLRDEARRHGVTL